MLFKIYYKNIQISRIIFERESCFYLSWIYKGKSHTNEIIIDSTTEKISVVQKEGNKVLSGTGQISHEVAVEKATNEYEKFRINQDIRYISQFDIEMDKYLRGEK